MSGGVFRARGGSGRAPTTSWFGAVPDRLSLLTHSYLDLFNGVIKLLSWTRIQYGNQMVVWDQAWAAGGASTPSCVLGPTTTAPDGGSTAQKITEGTNNGYHGMVAGCYDEGLFFPTRRRFAAFVKAAERTRCWMGISDGRWGSASDTGVRVVFDLAGGQVGVAATQYGTDTTWGVVGTEITPYGDGWYLCKLDVVTSNKFLTSTAHLSCFIGPDSGTGAGALSNSYTGNGTSGIYVWRVNLLPPRAWGINGVTFFDDFNDNTMPEIDLTNSRVPGFKWYVNGSWAIEGFNSTSMPICTPYISVASSILTVHKTVAPDNLGWCELNSAAYDGAGGYVGNVFQPPCLIECRSAYHMDYNFGGAAFWSVSVESLTKPGNPYTTPFYVGRHNEIDFFEGGFTPSDYYAPQFSVFTTSEQSPNYMAGMTTSNGIPAWQSNIGLGYHAGSGVSYNGVIYKCILDSANNQPDISPTFWQVFTTPDATMPTIANTLSTDFLQMHTYSYLWLPDNSVHNGNDPGEILIFFDETFIFGYVGLSNVQVAGGGHNLYGANLTTQTTQTPTGFIQADGNHFAFFLQGGKDKGDVYFDWVRVTQ